MLTNTYSKRLSPGVILIIALRCIVNQLLKGVLVCSPDLGKGERKAFFLLRLFLVTFFFGPFDEFLDVMVRICANNLLREHKSRNISTYK